MGSAPPVERRANVVSLADLLAMACPYPPMPCAECGRPVDLICFARMCSEPFTGRHLCPDCEAAAQERQRVKEQEARIHRACVARQRLRDQALLPPAALGVGFERLELKRYRGRQGAALDLARAWRRTADGWRAPWFFGPRGLGKTTIAWAMLNRELDEGRPGLYLGVADMLRRMRDGIMDHDAAADLSRRAVEAPFLVLDDFSPPNMTPWALETLFNITNERLNHRLSTVVITNYGPGDLAAQLTPARAPELAPTAEAVEDRVIELCIPCELRGGSIRVEQALERQAAGSGA